MSTCTYCDGKKKYSVMAVQETHGDFIGDRVRTKAKHIANPPCRHCKGTGECELEMCRCDMSFIRKASISTVQELVKAAAPSIERLNADAITERMVVEHDGKKFSIEVIVRPYPPRRRSPTLVVYGERCPNCKGLLSDAFGTMRCHCPVV